MPRSEVALATRNPKVLYLVSRLLKSLGVEFVMCSPKEKRCKIARVVITTSGEVKHFHPNQVVIVEDSAFDEDATTIDIMVKLLDIGTPSTVVIGVDPGMTFGLALLIDGKTVHARSTGPPVIAADETLRWAAKIKQRYQNETVVRVGTGSKLFATLYLRYLRGHSGDFRVELADERHTTLVGESDSQSAILIASRRGRKVTDSDYVLDPKNGHIKSLKRFYSRLTGNSKSLSTEDAKSVLLDRLTIEDLMRRD
ncbi:MAG: hypothetical protein ACFE7R_01565 [Candidatus Hodarchaeota archaeon]